ncbi:winged helix-turn-helix domain-containing protein [Pseudothauera rhizosphaerae]|uniref:Winged helix-turn-helix transcriptional regulator n=1 Tax=Pseudothauera rhizosphaerae TaxID=2565932 RepID=A0A4S4AR63_9RHOO|nr:winged helix-turn-helix domain-containing protein [Pseudothauera rhizosphaerae]THF60936.1 winged helix-turn-helix transcriptional regulator [Pseudothauera rhizosphaerae]
MNAPHPAPDRHSLTARILRHIERATSKAPARAADVGRALGIEPGTLDAALDRLQRHRAIATARIQRAGDDEMWLAIWPTGIHVETGSWTGNRHSALFPADVRPRRFPAAPDPQRDPRPDLSKPAAPPDAAPQVAPAGQEGPVAPAHEPARPMARAGSAAGVSSDPASTQGTTMTASASRRLPGQLSDHIRQIVAGLTADHGISAKSIGDMLGVTQATVSRTLARLVSAGDLATIQRPGRRGQVCCYYDPAAGAGEPDAAHRIEPAPDADPATDLSLSGAACPDMTIRFALWDDGALDILDGAVLTQLPREAVARLALLLAGYAQQQGGAAQ